jgi:hypothetical protein
MLRKNLKIILALILALWGFLTLIVVIALVSKSANPGTKGISNRDLVDYGKISAPVLAVTGLLFVILHMTKSKLRR